MEAVCPAQQRAFPLKSFPLYNAEIEKIVLNYCETKPVKGKLKLNLNP